MAGLRILPGGDRHAGRVPSLEGLNQAQSRQWQPVDESELIDDVCGKLRAHAKLQRIAAR